MEEIKELSVQLVSKNLIPAFIVLIAGLFINKFILKATEKLLDKSTRIDPMVKHFIPLIEKIILWIILIVTILKQLGFDISSILTVLAAASAAVALALQDSLSNLAAGILLLFGKTFSYGDYISCGNSEGNVVGIDMLYTTINTFDNRRISIPNSQIINSYIVNNDGNKTRRVDVNIGIAYGSSIELAENAMISLAEKSGYFLSEPACVCHVIEYGDSAIKISFRGWVEHQDYWDAYFYMNDNLKSIFDNAGIEIPFPQLDVHKK